MVTKNMKRNSIAAIAALLLIGAATSANAVLLAPGVTAPAGTASGASTTSEFAGTVVGTATVFIDNIYDINPTSTITEYVVKRTVGGTLDFYFQINSTGGAYTGLIHQFNANFYAGFTTDVFWDNSPVVSGNISQAGNPLNGFASGSATPDTFGRSAGVGNAVQFFFPDTPVNGGTGALMAGQKSKWLVIRTNATNAGGGMVAVINGLSQNLTMLGPVPEPGSVIFGLGVLGVMGTRVIRRRNSGCA